MVLLGIYSFILLLQTVSSFGPHFARSTLGINGVRHTSFAGNSHPLAATTRNRVDISSMRIREIQDELKERGVAFADCFDRESLVDRLARARENNEGDPNHTPMSKPIAQDTVETKRAQSCFDSVATLQELRSKRVSELRSECGKRNIRWAGMFEKEDLVQALLKAREEASTFSANISPGEVGELTDAQLAEELDADSSSPLLLDVFATWCGPCKLMAPELVKVAAALGNKVRVAKIDSDQYPDWSRKLKVQAFPTVIVFQDGKEVQRVEGALMKNQLLNLVMPYISVNTAL